LERGLVMASATMRGLFLVVVAAGLAGCSGGPGSTEPTGSESAALSSDGTSRMTEHAVRAPAFVTLSAASKGGFEVSRANSSSSPQHVGQLDFSKSGLDAATVAAVTAAPADELVLEGTVSSGTLFVTAVYRGMPAVTYDSSATFYQAGGPVAHALNETVTRSFTSVDATAAALPHVDPTWLAWEVTSNGAIVAGHVTQATKTLTAQQVFLPLPYVRGPCVVTGPICKLGQVPTYTRDQKLCFDFAGCEAPGICPYFVPECGSGYTLASWTGTSSACTVYACDPSFIH
jgi:hypothetical protein